MPKPFENANVLYCNFCGKSQREVRNLIAGPSVFICDECVEICMEIINEKTSDKEALSATAHREARDRAADRMANLVSRILAVEKGRQALHESLASCREAYNEAKALENPPLPAGHIATIEELPNKKKGESK